MSEKNKVPTVSLPKQQTVQLNEQDCRDYPFLAKRAQKGCATATLKFTPESRMGAVHLNYTDEYGQSCSSLLYDVQVGVPSCGRVDFFVTDSSQPLFKIDPKAGGRLFLEKFGLAAWPSAASALPVNKHKCLADSDVRGRRSEKPDGEVTREDSFELAQRSGRTIEKIEEEIRNQAAACKTSQ